MFPIAVLYPLMRQSDFILTWGEDKMAEERVGMQVLAEPPLWDEKGEYNWKSMEICMEALAGGLIMGVERCLWERSWAGEGRGGG